MCLGVVRSLCSTRQRESVDRERFAAQSSVLFCSGSLSYILLGKILCDLGKCESERNRFGFVHVMPAGREEDETSLRAVTFFISSGSCRGSVISLLLSR